MEIRQEHGKTLFWLKESWLLWDHSHARTTSSCPPHFPVPPFTGQCGGELTLTRIL